MVAIAAPKQLTSYLMPLTQNHFGVRFDGDEPEAIPYLSSAWTNPYIKSVIQPYLPADHKELIAIFQNTCSSITPPGSSDAMFHLYRDPFTRCYVDFTLKDLANFSQVSKCCYLAAKSDAVWDIQLRKLLPNVISLSTCSFSSKQQFRIIFERIHQELRPYIAQFQRNEEVLHVLRGPNGHGGTVDRAWEKYQSLGGTQARNTFLASPWDVVYNSWDSPKGRIQRAYYEYESKNLRRILLAGDHYNGTVKSMNAKSQQSLCLRAIDELVPGQFNDQEKFEEVIQESETALRNKPQNMEVQ
jgi:hypothetical protein